MPAHAVPGGYPVTARRLLARRSQPPLHARPKDRRAAYVLQRAAAVAVLMPVFTLLSGIAGHPR